MVENRPVIRIGCALLFGALFADLILAQESTRPSGSAGEETLTEIVVTAEKREESAQKTPISMSVYTGAQLQEAGIHDVASLTRIDPSINFVTTTGEAFVAVRGVSSADTSEVGDPAVTVARDGFFTNRAYSLFSSLYDVARVEVLKGPQGTLFGRNALGGAVNIITQRPEKDFGGYADVDVGNFGAINLESAINLPLNDVVQFRISGTSLNHRGYRDNPGFPSGDDSNNQSARLQAMFRPWENFTGWIQVQYDRSKGTGDVAYTSAQGTSGYGSAGKLTPAVPYSVAKGFPLYAPFSNSLTDKRIRWEFSQGLPHDLALTYLGGYDNTTWQHALDATPYPGASNAPAQYLQIEKPSTQNHELRLSSAQGARLFWQIGAFYFREINSPIDSGVFEEGVPFTDQYQIHFLYDTATTSKAGFGQLAFKLSDQFRLSAGIRYTKDEKLRQGNAVLNCGAAGIPPFLFPVIGCVGTPPSLVTPGDGNISNSKLTYHAGIDWFVNDASMVYAKYDTGYKAGGFNSNGSAPSVPYDPETVTAYEVGSKNHLLNNRLEANVALFLMNYNGYQANQFTQLLSGSASGVFNAGNARHYGAEANIVFLVYNYTKVDAEISLLHAKFIKGSAVDGSTGIQVPLTGNPLPEAPEVSLTSGVERSWIAAGFKLTGRIDAKYQSRIYYDIFEHPDTSQRAYVTEDASLHFSPGTGQWYVQAYVRNLSNETYLADAARNSLISGNNYEFAPPRTYGLKVGIRF